MFNFFIFLKNVYNILRDMKIKIFDGFVDFYNFLSDHNLLEVHKDLEPFTSAYGRINVGCSCGKAKRIKMTEDAFIICASSALKEKDSLDAIKTAGQFSEIQVYINGRLLFKG